MYVFKKSIACENILESKIFDQCDLFSLRVNEACARIAFCSEANEKVSFCLLK